MHNRALEIATLLKGKVVEKGISLSSGNKGLYTGEVCPVGPCDLPYGHVGNHWDNSHDLDERMHSIRDVDLLFDELIQLLQDGNSDG